MHNEVDEIYRQYRKQVAQEADTDLVWSRLEDSLDIDQVWTRIDHSLTRRKRRRVVIFAILLGLIPVLSGLIMTDNWSSPDNNMRFAGSGYLQYSGFEESEKVEHHLSSATSVDDEKKSLGTADEHANLNAISAQPDDNHRQYTVDRTIVSMDNWFAPAHTATTEISTNSQNNDLDIPKEFTVINVVQRFLTKPVALGSIAVKNPALPSDTFPSTRFYANLSTGLKTSWLLNNHTYKSLQKESFVYLERQYYPVASIGLGMQRNKWSYETNLFVLDYGGQQVNYLSEGKAVYQQTRLRYTTAEILAGYRLRARLLHSYPVYSTLYGGLYTSLLTKSDYSTNLLNGNRDKSYRNADLGVVARFSLGFPIGRSWQVQTSLGFQSGVLNITKTQNGIPSYFDRSYNASCAAYLTLKYFFH